MGDGRMGGGGGGGGGLVNSNHMCVVLAKAKRTPFLRFSQLLDCFH